MGHHALSKDGHRQKASQNRATLYQAAVEAWKKDSLSNSHAPALSKIVAQFPGINQTTLWCYIRGQTDSKCDSAAKHALLTPTESQELVQFIIEMGDCSFPLTYKKISKYALSIVHIHNNNVSHIGTNWATHFVHWFEEEIGAKTCSLLEKIHAASFNQTTVE